MAGKCPFSRQALLRIVLDLLAEEVSRSRGRSAVELGRAGWGEATRVDETGLDLDSLERIEAAAALNEFFHLHAWGAEDYLLALPTVGEWCDLVEQSLQATGDYLTFRTSGSTGQPKRCTHAVAELAAEADGWAEYFGSAPSVVSMVPAHHIYGAMFTAFLPDRLGPDCTVTRAAGADPIGRAPTGALVVATPTHWAYLARSLLAFPEGLVGVTSTAPMPDHLATRLRGQRLSRLVEVYGSSETGGVAVREHERAAFTLLDRWNACPDGMVERRAADETVSSVTLPDATRWLDERSFVLEGRLDGAVQIGGHNVFPARVREALLAHAGVADAAVRLEPETGRLKAFVVPSNDDPDRDRLVGELDRWCGAKLSGAERPRRFSVGGALPMNAMGKLTDW